MLLVYSQWRKHLLQPFNFYIWVTVTIVATVAAPFGTYVSVPFLKRMSFWTVAIGWSIITAFLVMLVGHAFLPQQSDTKKETNLLRAFYSRLCANFMDHYWRLDKI